MTLSAIERRAKEKKSFWDDAAKGIGMVQSAANIASSINSLASAPGTVDTTLAANSDTPFYRRFKLSTKPYQDWGL